MNLSDYNLYQNARVYRLENGEELQMRSPIQWQSQAGDRWHTLAQGESLDWLAYHYYQGIRPQAERYWWLIAEVNGIDQALELEAYVGKALLIPDIQALDFLRAES